MEYSVGDIVETKKQHPCGSNTLNSHSTWHASFPCIQNL